jgi:hypothetical protein
LFSEAPTVMMLSNSVEACPSADASSP